MRQVEKRHLSRQTNYTADIEKYLHAIYHEAAAETGRLKSALLQNFGEVNVNYSVKVKESQTESKWIEEETR